MKNNLIIIGAGGIAFEVLNYISEIFKPIEIKKIFIFGKVKNKNEFNGLYNKCFFINKIPNYLKKHNTNFIVAHGNENLRSKYFKRYVKKFMPLKLVHPTAYISPSAKILDGAIVGPKTILSPGCIIKKNVLLNSGSQIGHHSVIGESTIISTGAIINGNVTIGSVCFIGSNSTVMQNLKISNFSKVSANSALYNDLKSKHIAHGNPAKQQKLNFY
jgi:UDP-N-acetylbacillosamine N-acetyltransferase